LVVAKSVLFQTPPPAVPRNIVVLLTIASEFTRPETASLGPASSPL
jgi:hypothetical protein